MQVYRGGGRAARRRPSSDAAAGYSRQRRCFVRVRAEVFQLGSSWVVTPAPPRRPSSSRPRPKGVVHFLGGAFAGAAPQLVYSLLLDLLASAGYTVVATPYAVTFQHLDCADAVRSEFEATLQALRADTGLASLAPAGAPTLGVGHSNGALLHLLIGSRRPGANAANTVISYNNKQVGDAIPIPGFLSTMTPTISALRAAPPPPIPLPDSGTVLRTLAGLLPPQLNADAAGQLSRAGLALDQVTSVLGEVGDGVTDFSPSPAESRALIRAGYDASVSPLLMVRFTDDSIDETPEVARLLQAANPTGVSFITLPGSHVTPCGGDIPWQPGPVFSPVDVVAQLAKVQAQRDVRRLSDVIVDFLDKAVVAAR